MNPSSHVALYSVTLLAEHGDLGDFRFHLTEEQYQFIARAKVNHEFFKLPSCMSIQCKWPVKTPVLCLHSMEVL